MLRKPILLILLAVFLLAVPAVHAQGPAEVQIVGENLSVSNGSGNAAMIDSLAGANPALTDSVLKRVVRDQIISWGNPYAFLSTSNKKMLYFLSDPTARTGC